MSPKAISLLSLAIILALPSFGDAVANTAGNCDEKTPSNFQSTFVKNCRNQAGTTEDKCNSAYSEFLGAFANMNQTNVKPESYDDYFKVLPITAGQDQSLFWSRTFLVVKELSKRTNVKIVSSETSAAGSILNEFNMPNLCWCSELGNNGLVVNSVCPKYATSFFWAQFSVTFAKAAKGTIFFLANGEANPAYNPSSFFGCYELANITPDVKRLVVLNAHRSSKGEACGTSSLRTLQGNVTDKGLNYTCYDLHINNEVEKSTNAIATCVETVVRDVQNNKVPGTTVLQCNGATCLQVSFFILVAVLLASKYWI